MIENSIKQQIILAMDSSAGACSVAVWKNHEITAYCEEKLASMQSKRLIQMTEEAMAASTIGYNDLDSIACTVGPGSFTGIRIGLASARAIGFAAQIPVNGFSALAVVAFAELGKQKSPIKSILNAGKGEVVCQDFSDNLEELNSPELVKMEQDMLIHTPRADMLAKLAAFYPQLRVEPLPLYVRPPDAKLPLEIYTVP